MKRIFLMFISALMAISLLAGCGDDAKSYAYNRLNYKNGLDKYVTLGDYSAITINRGNEEYLEVFENYLKGDLGYYTYEVKSGKVKDGDVVNIDYVGSVDNVAFTGGTAKGFDLTIGSGTFIEGFEEQLIGVKVGKTVKINVTFPEGYSDTTDLETNSKTIKLSGTKAQFEVKINYISRSYEEINNDFAKLAGFENKEEYIKDVTERSTVDVMFNALSGLGTVNSLPPEDEGNAYSYYKDYYISQAQQYGMTFENFLTNNNISEADFKKEVLTFEMIVYATFDKLGLTLEENALNNKYDEMAKGYSATVEEVKKYYPENYLEFIVVREKVQEKLLTLIKVIGE